MPSNRKANKKPSAWTNKQPGSQRHARLKVNAHLLREAKQTSHTIVMNLLEVGVSEDYFINQIRYITPDDYNDVVTERSIADICGYPLCDSVLIQKYENQTYIIRHNKVYDITHRRQFCSDKCYEASELVFEQIPTLPPYLRSADKDITNFKLVLPDLVKLKGRYGKLVKIAGTELDDDVRESYSKQLKLFGENEKEEKKNTKESPTSHTDLSSSMSVDSSINLSTSKEDTSSCSMISDSSRSFGLSPSQKFAQDSSALSTDSEAYLSEEAQKLNLDDSSPYPSEEEPSRVTLRSDGKPIVRKAKPKNEGVAGSLAESPFEHIYDVERALREWMTFESLRMVLGDNYVKGMLEELGKSWEDYDTTAGLRLGVESKSRYIALCQRLDAEERREKVLDANDTLADSLADTESSQQELEPVPDYKQLKKDVEQSSLKVKAFYEGKEIVEDVQDSLQTIYEEEESGQPTSSRTAEGTKRKAKDNKNEDEVDYTSLPLIDAYSQKTWRRQIVVEKLNKILAGYAMDFGLDEKEILRLAVSLVATFDLTAHNICFQVKQWKLVGLIIMKMLSVRYPVIEESILPGGRGFDQVSSFLSSEGLDPDYLNRVLSYLTEISYILTKYHNDDVSAPCKDPSLVEQGVAASQSESERSSMKNEERNSSGEVDDTRETDKSLDKNLTDVHKTFDKNLTDVHKNLTEVDQDKAYTNYEELD